MKHKSAILILISVLLLMLVVTAASAEEVTPYASGANSVTVKFSISNGVGTASAVATTMATGTYPKLTIYIQKKVGTKWETVKTGSGGREAEITYSVEKGILYRGRAVLKVYNSSGEQVDELSVNSNSRSWD